LKTGVQKIVLSPLKIILREQLSAFFSRYDDLAVAAAFHDHKDVYAGFPRCIMSGRFMPVRPGDAMLLPGPAICSAMERMGLRLESSQVMRTP
jgi:hypothetical protein